MDTAVESSITDAVSSTDIEDLTSEIYDAEFEDDFEHIINAISTEEE